MVQETENPEVTKEGAEQAQAEVPAKEDAVVKTEGSVEPAPAEEPRSAPYKVAGVHESDVRLAVQRPDGKTDPLHLRIDDERSVRWMLDNTHAVVLRRDE